MELEGWEEIPTELASGGYFEELKDLFKEDLMDFFGEIIPSTTVSPASPESPAPP